MVLANTRMCDCKFIPVLNECFLNLKIIAQSMTNECVRKNTLHEFLYKLKCLEKELYLISTQLRETTKKNETLTKDLESEKEKSRKRAARIHELESQLANAEFKLKLRQGSKERSKITRDASFQYGCRLDSSADLFNTMQTLRETAHETINSIRELITFGGGDFKMTPTTKQFEGSLDMIGNLRRENEYLQKLISEKDKLLNHLSLTTCTCVKRAPKTELSDGSDSESSVTLTTNNVQTLERDDVKPDWNDPDYPYRVIKSMERKIQKLKTGSLGKSNITPEFASKLCRKNLTIQQKIEDYFDRKSVYNCGV